MKTAFSFALLGIALCLILGTQKLNLSVPSLLFCLWISNVGGFFSLFATLQLEKVAWFKRTSHRTAKTWLVITSLYFGSLIGFCPPLRDWEAFAYLAFPLLLSTGLAIIAFGPIQDRIIRHGQRKTQSQSKSDFTYFPSDSPVL